MVCTMVAPGFHDALLTPIEFGHPFRYIYICVCVGGYIDYARVCRGAMTLASSPYWDGCSQP